jgi:hypothetical protein
LPLSRGVVLTRDTSLKKWYVHNRAEKRGKKGKKAKEKKPMAEALPSDECFLIGGRDNTSS